MTTLRLAIDAQGMRTGASQAQSSLRDIQRSASDTARAVDSIYGSGTRIEETTRKIGSGFRDSVQAVGGLVQTGGNIAALTRQVGDLGTGMTGVSNATLIASRGLLEFVRIGHDIRQMRDSIGETASRSSTLALLWRAHPLLLITSGLSLVASAMALFGSNTKKASEESEKLAKSQRDLASALETVAQRRELLAIRERTGQQVSPLDQVRTQRDFLTEQAQQISAAGRGISLGDLSRLLQVRQEDVIRYGGQRVGAEIFAQSARDPRNIGQAIIQVTDAQRIIEARIRSLEQQVRVGAAAEELATFQRGAPQPLVGVSLADRYGPTEAEARKQEENIERQRTLELMREELALQEQLQQLYEAGSQVGASLGGAFFSVVNGVNSARQAVALLIQDLARLAQSLVIRGLGDAIGGVFTGFGPTSTQRGSEQGSFTGI